MSKAFYFLKSLLQPKYREESIPLSNTKPMTSRRLRRILFQPVEYAAVRLVIFALGFLTVAFALRIGAAIGVAAFSVFRVRRKVAMKNLEVAFPDMDARERIAVARRSYANLGRTFMEFLMLKKIDEAYIEKHVTIREIEHILRALDKGKGLIAMTAHYGNWEIMGAAFGLKGYILDVIATRQKNRSVDRLFNGLRYSRNIGLIFVDEAPKGVLRSLKKGRTVAILGDQEARRGAGVIVDFFNRATSVHQGAALFSLKTGAPIVCVFITRKATGRDHEIVIEAPLEFEPTDDRAEDIRRLTAMYVARLEAWIRKHPDHWFWAHKRWKSSGLYEED